MDDLTLEELAELGDTIVPPHKTPMPCDDFATWMNDVYFKFRGLVLAPSTRI